MESMENRTSYLRVPRLDPSVEFAELGSGMVAAVERVLQSGRYIGGPEIDSFENEAAEFLGCSHAISVASGTDALTIALIAATDNIDKERREVVTTSLSFSATASAIVRAGFRPRFVDISCDGFGFDLQHLSEALGPTTAAVLPVALYGQPLDISGIRACSEGLPVIEDACQAFGARDEGGEFAGTQSDVGTFSFFPSKPLGGFGDGGLIVTNNSHIAAVARVVGRHGCSRRYISERLGFNSRLDALQAALLRHKLRFVETYRQRRKEIAEIYLRRLAGFPGIVLPTHSAGHAWHCFTILIKGGCRDLIAARLQESGIETAVQYPVPLHMMPAFRTGQKLPAVERICAELLCLPIWAGMTSAQIEHVAAQLMCTEL